MPAMTSSLLVQVYDQVAASRNRLSQQLSAKNRYIRHLESILEDRTTVSKVLPQTLAGFIQGPDGRKPDLGCTGIQVVANAHTAVLRIANELDSIKRLSEVAIAAASYGVDKADVIARSERIIKRAALLQQVSNSWANKFFTLCSCLCTVTSAQSCVQAMFSEADTLNKLVTRKVPVVWYGVARLAFSSYPSELYLS